MTLIYLDLFTNLIFLLLIGYFIKNGLPDVHVDSSPYLQKFNQLIYGNHWLYALPYFYTISLINDFESLFDIKSYAIQILYFLCFTIIHILMLLKIQQRFLLEYVWLLKNSSKKFRHKFFKVNQENGSSGEESLLEKQNINLSFIELDFLMNSFGLPLLFALTNSYVITKILFFIIKSK